MYQLLRSLAYIHSVGICRSSHSLSPYPYPSPTHSCRTDASLLSRTLPKSDRDIKPQNLLIHPTTGVLKLIDFGSAKILVPGEPNVSYICSRYYRAPELIFGSTNYTPAIGEFALPSIPFSDFLSFGRILTKYAGSLTRLRL